MKRFTGFLVALLILFPMAVHAADYESHWAGDSIQFLIKNEALKDVQASELDYNMKRYQFAELINKVCKFQKRSEKAFSDITSPDELAQFQIADAAGYIKGDAEGNANPDGEITRAEVAVILARLYDLEPGRDKTTYQDNESLPEWCLGSVAALQEKGLFSGYEDNTFRADHLFTNAEGYTIGARIFRDINTNQSFAGGNGSEKFPFKVASYRQFASIPANHPEYYYEQIADFVWPTGLEMQYPPMDVFSGHYDGGGLKITNSAPGNNNSPALFVKNKGTIENVKLEDVSITDSDTGAGICSTNEGSILNCRVSGSISAKTNAAGVCITNAGTIAGCTISGKISADTNAAGVCITNAGTIADCTISGNISSRLNAGAIAAMNKEGISCCINFAEIKGSFAGGIAAFNEGGMISSSQNKGSIAADFTIKSENKAEKGGEAGGIVCHNNKQGKIMNCVNTSGGESLQAIYLLGGIAASNSDAEITRCLNAAKISASAKNTDLIINPPIQIAPNRYLGGEVKNDGPAKEIAFGGICARSTNGAIQGCANIAGIDLSIVNMQVKFGGIAGELIKSTVSDCYNSGRLLLYENPSERHHSIPDPSTSFIGGIAGGTDGTIERCYNVGAVYNVVNKQMPTEADIDTFTQASFGPAAGILGSFNYSVEINNTYHLKDVPPLGRSVLGFYSDSAKLLRSKSEMTDQANYNDYDFETVWIMGEVPGYEYPTLRGVTTLAD